MLPGHVLTETPWTFLWLWQESISCFPEINPGLQLWGPQAACSVSPLWDPWHREGTDNQGAGNR